MTATKQSMRGKAKDAKALLGTPEEAPRSPEEALPPVGAALVLSHDDLELLKAASEAPVASTADLNVVGALAQELVTAEKRVAFYDAKLKEAKALRRQLSETDLPEAMFQAGLKKLTTKDGAEIVVEDVVTCGAIKKPEALAWLRDHKFGAVIKKCFVLAFNAKETEAATAAEAMFAAQGLEPKVTEEVHASTAKALVRELAKNGKDFPREAFGAWLGTRAKVVGAPEDEGDE